MSHTASSSAAGTTPPAGTASTVGATSTSGSASTPGSASIVGSTSAAAGAAPERRSFSSTDQGAVGPDVVVLDHTGYVGHGNTIAAWVCLGTVSLGVLLALVGFVIALGHVLMWIGLVVIVIGLILGAVLKAQGLGYEGAARKHEEELARR